MPFIQLQLQLTVSSIKLPTEADPCLLPLLFCRLQAPRAMMRRRRSCTAFFLSRRSPYTPATRNKRPGADKTGSVDPGPGRPGTANSRLEPGSGPDPFSFFFPPLISPAVGGAYKVSHILFLIPQLELIFFLVHVGDWIGSRSRPSKKDQTRWGKPKPTASPQLTALQSY